MKLVFLAFALMLILPVHGLAVIENLTVDPQNAYIGENIALSFRCFSTNSAVQSVKATITGPGIVIPDVYIPGGPDYLLTLDRSYIDRIGAFTATVSCRDSEAESNGTVIFSASQVSGGIKSISPQQIYAGDLVDLVFVAEKNNVSIMNVNFSLYVDGEETGIRTVLYDTSKGWILRFNAPNSIGTHTVKAIAQLDRTSIIDDEPITIRNPVEFSIVSIDRNAVTAGDNISITVSATDHGTTITPLFSIFFGDTQVAISETTHDSKYTYLKLTVPQITPKSYTLRAEMDYNSYIYQDYRTIDYIIPFTGNFVSDGKAVNTQVRVIKGGVEKIKLYTDAAGSFSTTIVPDVYDLEFIFPESTFKLKGVNIDSFNNPVSYTYSQDAKIPGVKTNGVFFYGSSLPFSRALIDVPYNEQELDEETMKVYKCPVWSGQEKACRTSWLEMNANIDKQGNIVHIDVDSLGAFAIGMRQKITLGFNIDKKIYTVKDIVRLRGNIQDLSKQPIQNGKIAVRIGNSEIGNISSDNNGVFTIEFVSPDADGNYTFTVTASKQPYVNAEKSDSFEVRRVKAVSILFPDSIKAATGKNVTKELIVINTGQENLQASVQITGIDLKYTINKNLDIPIGGQDTAGVTFYVPAGAEEKVITGTLKIHSESFDKEKQFTITIEKQIEEKPQVTGLSIGMPVITLPQLGSFISIALFAALSFTAAFVAKKLKSRKRDDHMAMLQDIKNHIKSRDRKRHE